MKYGYLQYSSLAQLLCYRSGQCTDRKKIDFLNDFGAVDSQLSYGELDKSARAIATELIEGGFVGRHIIILASPGPEYIQALFGCLYAGAIPVPADPPMGGRDLNRLVSIIKDCDAPLVLTNQLLVDYLDNWMQDIDHQVLACVAVERLVYLGDSSFEPVLPQCDDVALLQYTSGTTGQPKGVMVSHESLLQNVRQIIFAFSGVSDVHALDTEVLRQLFGTVSWLPPFHDMGLIGGILSPLYAGTHVTLMSPITFLRNPYIWLKTISERKALISGGPNFSFDYCVKKITAKQKETLDLSSWRLAFNAAEPIKASTMENFSDYFADCGFNASSFVPCYGLSEATLLASAAIPETGFSKLSACDEALKKGMYRASDDGRVEKVLVSSGREVDGNRIAIVDPVSLSRLGEGEIGEVWIQGPAVCHGYWGKPGYSMSVFAAKINREEKEGSFLRSGDLGFLYQGELFITGRMKELIILNGQNYYPQDLELSLQSRLESLRKGCGAAFSVDRSEGESLVLVQEFDGSDFSKPAMLDLCLQARAILSCAHGVDLSELLLVRVGDLAKTSSGKIQRAEMKKRFLEGNIDAFFRWSDGKVQTRLWKDREDTLLTEFKLWIADYLVIEAEEVDLNISFADMGVESSVAIELIYELEEVVGREISNEELQRFDTVQALLQYFCDELSQKAL